MGIEATNLPEGKTAEEVLEPIWDVMGEPPNYPTDTATVFRLLRIAGRDFNRSRFDYLLKTEQLKPPSTFSGRYAWDAMDIARAIAVCDVKRWWVVGSPIFDKNASLYEKARVVIKANPNDYKEQKSRLDQISVRDLALSLLGFADPKYKDRAQAFFALIEDKLELSGME